MKHMKSIPDLKCTQKKYVYAWYGDGVLGIENTHMWKTNTYSKLSTLKKQSNLCAIWILSIECMCVCITSVWQYVTWLIHMCDRTHSFVFLHVSARSWLTFTCDMTLTRVTELMRMCAMTHSYVCWDSFICVPWLIHICAMTHSYVCHDSFICLPWLIHMWHASFIDMCLSSEILVSRTIIHGYVYRRCTQTLLLKS